MKEICCPKLIGDSPLHHFYQLASLILADHLHVRQKDATNLISGSDAALISTPFNNNYESQMREEARRANSLDFKAGMCTIDKNFNAAPSQKYFSRRQQPVDPQSRAFIFTPCTHSDFCVRDGISLFGIFSQDLPDWTRLYIFGKWAQSRN